MYSDKSLIALPIEGDMYGHPRTNKLKMKANKLGGNISIDKKMALV
ncbi:hypothetical protein GCM10007940_38910 [Portibacter lacus]|uniref:Uncharacterized protein n=1 Tax=Portibacter lacus TaxID=1099794 RepID=A0AA37WI46_9BACT|nr:hypothetical protein GCM10007940_38910 [Portibacter lacus]